MTFSYTRYYPDGRRPFNLADYMNTNTRPDRNMNSNTNSISRTPELESYLKQFYNNPKPKPQGKEVILWTNKQCVKTDSKGKCKGEGGITLADLLGENKLKYYL
jgi:hypothetical protein